tara:strand:- start:17 stop:580 length:564 start_codon:yes stop_codon:yes gene_type:complete
MLAKRTQSSGFGLQTATLMAGGSGVPNTIPVNVELYDGTCWTETANVNLGRYALGGAGTQTSGLIFAGYNTAVKDETESWNGTAWTEVAEVNTTRTQMGSAGTSNIDALVIGGTDAPGRTLNVEQWNGTSWTEVNNLAVVNSGGVADGTTTAAFFTGGTVAPGGPNVVATTQEWNVPQAITNLVMSD